VNGDSEKELWSKHVLSLATRWTCSGEMGNTKKYGSDFPVLVTTVDRPSTLTSQEVKKSFFQA